jgi:hypothetical protein
MRMAALPSKVGDVYLRPSARRDLEVRTDSMLTVPMGDIAGALRHRHEI